MQTRPKNVITSCTVLLAVLELSFFVFPPHVMIFLSIHGDMALQVNNKSNQSAKFWCCLLAFNKCAFIGKIMGKTGNPPLPFLTANIYSKALRYLASRILNLSIFYQPRAMQFFQKLKTVYPSPLCTFKVHKCG